MKDYCLQAALVCLGVLCHSQAFGTERRSHLRPSFHGHHEKGKEGQVLQRSKRGWVWNQFFVIEEYTGPDPVLVGRVRPLAPLSAFPPSPAAEHRCPPRTVKPLLRHPSSLSIL